MAAFTCAPDGTALVVNDRMRHLLRQEPGQPVPRRLHDLVAEPTQADQWLAALKAPGSRTQQPLAFHCPDHVTTELEVTAQHVVDGEREAEAVVAVAEALDARHGASQTRTRAERWLHGGPEWSRALVESANDSGVGLAIVAMGAEGPRLSYINAAGLSLLGATDASSLAQRQGLFLTDGLDALLRRRRSVSALAPPTVEVRLPSGRTRTIEVGLGAGTYWGRPAVVAFFSDVTRRERAVRQLREAEARLRVILDGVPLALVTVDGTRTITQVRGGALAELGLSDALTGRTIHDLVDRLPEASNIVMAGLGGHQGHGIIERGESRWSVTCTPVPAPGGGRPGAIVMIHDISAAMELEAAQRHATELKQESVRLHELADYKSRIINRVAHNLNTPMTPIMLTAARLTDSARTLPEQERQMIATMQRNCERLKGVIGTLLDVARLETDRDEIHKEPVDLAALVEALRAAAPSDTNLRLAPITRPHTVHVDADRHRLGDALATIATALAAADPDEPHVVTVNVDVEAPWTVMTLHEDTPRPPGSSMEAAFDAFAEDADEDAPTPRSSELGLDLYRARLVIERHGGSITAALGPSGTDVHVRLPLSGQA